MFNKMTKAAFMGLLLLPSVYGQEIMGRRFDILLGTGDANVEMRDTQCIMNKNRDEYTQQELDRKDRETCYYLEIQNAYIVFRNGEQHGPINIKTQPMLYGVTPTTGLLSDISANRSCVQGIASALERRMNGQELYQYPENHPSAGRSYERFSIPEFIGSSFDDDGNMVVETAPGTITGNWNQTFTYAKSVRTRGGDIPEGTVENCHPASFEQRVEIVDQVFTRVENEDATFGDHVVNAGRNGGRLLGRLWEGTGELIRRTGEAISQ